MGCYNPWNYQARAMISRDQGPHVVPACDGDFEPSYDQAIAETLRMDWVGLQDFYHESICLLVFRVGGKDHPYLQSCACDADNENPVAASSKGAKDLHIDHNTAHHRRKSYLDLDAVTTAKVDRLSAVDK